MTATLIAVVLGMTTIIAAPRAAAATPVPVTYDMTVLVLDDGSAMVAAWIDYFNEEGIAHTDLDLNDSSRAALTLDYLAEWGTSAINANFYGVVAPSAAPTQLATEELAALTTYQTTLSVRQLSVYNWANPSLGLNYPVYSGKVDGLRASVTDYATSNGFAYLTGVTMDDLAGDVDESYGYLALPIEATANTRFDPVLTAPIPGQSVEGVLAGVLTQDGREQMVLTFAANQYQNHFKTLAPGMLSWLTRGISTSYHRAYFSVNIDDVLMGDELWDMEADCTPSDTGCQSTQDTVSRMSVDDVAYLIEWQEANDFKLDLTYNAAGTVEYTAENGSDPVAAELLANESSFRWLSHTWSHAYLGCQQDDSTTPWSCATDASGNEIYASKKTIVQEIKKNRRWAYQSKLTDFKANSLVTGEHSGLQTLPQMPADNPALAAALRAGGIRWVASDASREPEQRKITNGINTVPRYPMNIFYNVETEAEETDEYSWIYTSKADGGSGLCEMYSDIMTCIEPLDNATGFDDYIAPLESQIALSHVLGNDPRPHYVHEANLAGDRIIYPVVDAVLATYRADFAENAPLINPDLATAGRSLQLQTWWNTYGEGVEATISGSQVRLTNNTTTKFQVPLTVPTGTKRGKKNFGSAYGGQQSAWTAMRPGKSMQVTLPAGEGFPETAVGPGEPKAAPEVKVAERRAPANPTVELPDAAPPIVDPESVEALADETSSVEPSPRQ